MDKMDNQEMISALADGQLRGEAFARGVQLASTDARAREAWYAYHVVGEVLRTGRASVGSAPDAFLARLQVRLQQEEQRPVAVMPADAVVGGSEHAAAANDRRWKLVAGLASFAAVAAVGWNVWGGLGAGTGQPQLAGTPAVQAAVAAASAAPLTMVRDPGLDKFLAAHRQLGGATALGTPSGFLRNATFEGPAR
ncbi:MAG TPA: sigma-E factor negative regulatory protein [Ramlibacter sp.]|nr:sigma-E factor negative regulatory protein [Ramlibacter sp.]